MRAAFAYQDRPPFSRRRVTCLCGPTAAAPVGRRLVTEVERGATLGRAFLSDLVDRADQRVTLPGANASDRPRISGNLRDAVMSTTIARVLLKRAAR